MKNALIGFVLVVSCWGQEVVTLWPEGAPGSEARKGEQEKQTGAGDQERIANIHNPSLTIYLPEKPTGVGIVVCPGGGHRHLAIEHEGRNVAKYFNKLGVAVFVLKYRLAKAEGSTYTVEGHALADVKRAMRVVRNHATQWKLDEKKIGVMGFSAGGELAALASSRFDVEGGVSSRPDFQALIYPGVKPGAIEFPKDAPPAFLLCADNDQGPSIGIASMYQSLKKAGVPTEIHIYETGGHGFGVREGAKTLVAKTWMDRLADWMRGRGLFSRGPGRRGL